MKMLLALLVVPLVADATLFGLPEWPLRETRSVLELAARVTVSV
jgi:hypothetical protein